MSRPSLDVTIDPFHTRRKGEGNPTVSPSHDSAHVLSGLGHMTVVHPQVSCDVFCGVIQHPLSEEVKWRE